MNEQEEEYNDLPYQETLRVIKEKRQKYILKFHLSNQIENDHFDTGNSLDSPDSIGQYEEKFTGP